MSRNTIKSQTWLKLVVDQSLDTVFGLLHQFANTPRFHESIAVIFGNSVDASGFQTAWMNRDFATFPPIEIRSAAEINGANGAFSRDTGKIYLAAEFITQNANNLEAITNVLLEEYGHFVDAQINVIDTPGDEGAIFARLVQGDILSEQQLAVLRAEDDTATVMLDGKETVIEMNTINGGNGNDFLFGTNGNDFIFGNDGNDFIFGNAGNDTIYGDEIFFNGTGNDFIDGGAGNDTIYGDGIIFGVSVQDIINGGDDTIYGGTGNDTIHGVGGNDTIYGDDGDNTIYGGTGNDLIYVGAGSNIVNGGAGNDTLSGKNNLDIGVDIGATIYLDRSYGGQAQSLKAGDYDVNDLQIGNDRLSSLKVSSGFKVTLYEHKGFTGSSRTFTANTVWVGNDFNDKASSIRVEYIGSNSLNGGDGDDTIDGGAGNDTIDGGTGNDTIYGHKGDDTIDGGTGNDTIDGNEGDDTIDGNEGDDTINGNEGDDTINGNEGDDTINGNEGDDRIYGGADNDTLDGGTGNDILDGGTGNDLINAGAGNDFIYAGTGNDTIDGGTGNDRIFGNDGDDTIFGDDGDDHIYGGYGKDTIYGNEGDDRIYGGADNDTLDGGTGNDILDGANGHDLINAGAGNDFIYAGNGNDTIDGGTGNDRIFGDDGDDTIFGNDGDDTIFGSAGNDTLDGGEGNDRVSEKRNVNFTLSKIPNDTNNTHQLIGLGTDSLKNIETVELQGGAGNNTLDASLATVKVELKGLEGNDTLKGGSEDDILAGGAGTNDLWGGEGSDTFVTEAGGIQIIKDFERGVDKIDMAQAQVNQISFDDSNQDLTIIKVNGEERARIEGSLVDSSSLINTSNDIKPQPLTAAQVKNLSAMLQKWAESYATSLGLSTDNVQLVNNNLQMVGGDLTFIDFGTQQTTTDQGLEIENMTRNASMLFRNNSTESSSVTFSYSDGKGYEVSNEDTTQWEIGNTFGLGTSVTVGGKAGIPFLAQSSVEATVETSYEHSFSNGGSNTKINTDNVNTQQDTSIQFNAPAGAVTKAFATATGGEYSGGKYEIPITISGSIGIDLNGNGDTLDDYEINNLPVNAILQYYNPQEFVGEGSQKSFTLPQEQKLYYNETTKAKVTGEADGAFFTNVNASVASAYDWSLSNPTTSEYVNGVNYKPQFNNVPVEERYWLIRNSEYGPRPSDYTLRIDGFTPAEDFIGIDHDFINSDADIMFATNVGVGIDPADTLILKAGSYGSFSTTQILMGGTGDLTTIDDNDVLAELINVRPGDLLGSSSPESLTRGEMTSNFMFGTQGTIWDNSLASGNGTNLLQLLETV